MQPTTKVQVLNEIKRAHQDLVRVLAAMSDDEKTAPILDKGWSVKDSLAHLVDWEKLIMDWLTRSLEGEDFKRVIPGFNYEALEGQESVFEAENQYLYEQSKGRELDDVLREFRATHRAVLDLVGQMNEDDIFDPHRFAWRQGSPALDLIAGDTYVHYDEHRGWILEGLDKPRADTRARDESPEAIMVPLADSGMERASVEMFVAPLADSGAQDTSAEAVVIPPNEMEQLLALRAAPHAAKAELMRKIYERHAGMAQLLSRLSLAQMTAPVLDGGWSVKDSLAHMVSWESLLLLWVGQYERGEKVTRWAPGFEIEGDNGEEQMHRFNAYLYEQNKARPLEQVLDDFRSTFTKVAALVEGLSEEAIFEPNYYPVREGRPLITLIAGDTYEHYDEHLASIKVAFQ